MMISKIYYGIVAALIFATLVACELFDEGFGEKVDLKGPVMAVSNINGEIVGGTYTLSGTAVDDTGLKSVRVEFLSPVTGSTETLPAQVQGINWRLDINTTDTSIFKDGSIELNIIATDNSDKATNKPHLIKIDNTAPTVLVMKINQSDDYKDTFGNPLKFNQKVKFTADVADDNSDRLVFTLINRSDNTIEYEGSTTKDQSWSYQFDTTNWIGGDYILNVVAYDLAGNNNSYFYHIADTYGTSISPTTRLLVGDIEANNEHPEITVIRRDKSTVGNQIVLNIDPTSDLPNIDLSNFEKSVTPTEHNMYDLKEYPETIKITGSLSDDDGIGNVYLRVEKGGVKVKEGAFNYRGSTYVPLSINISALNSNTDAWAGFDNRDTVYKPKVGNPPEYITYEPGDDIIGTIFDVEEYVTDYAANNVEVVQEGTYNALLIVQDVHGKSERLNFDFSINSQPPILTVDPIVGQIDLRYVNNNFLITGSASDSSLITSVKVYFKYTEGGIVKQLDPAGYDTVLTPTGGTNYDFSFDSSLYPDILTGDRDYTVTVTAMDFSSGTASESFDILVDTQLPTATVLYPEDNGVVNGKILVRGTSNDNRGVSNVSLKYRKDGDVTWSADVLSGNSSYYSWEYLFDTNVIESDDTGVTQLAQLQVIVTDLAGNTSVQAGNTENIITEFTVDQSKNKPVFDFTNIDISNNTVNLAKNNLIDTNAKITGSVSDDDGVEAGSIEIQIYNSNGSVRTPWTPVSNQKSEDSVFSPWSHDISSLPNGIYSVEVRASDNVMPSVDRVSNQSVRTFIAYDTDNPVVTILPYSGGLYIKDDFTIYGTLSDANGISAVSVCINNETDPSGDLVFTPVTKVPGDDIIQIDGNTTNGEIDNGFVNSRWKFSSILTDPDGAFNLKVKATDTFGKTSIVNGDYFLDREAPAFTLDTPVVPGIGELTYLNNNYEISGTADTNDVSGLKGIYAVVVARGADPGSIPDNAWVDVTGAPDWSTRMSAFALADGDYDLYVRALDKAGNQTAIADYSVREFTLDNVNPTLTASTIGAYSNIDVTFSGNVSDTSGLQSLIVAESREFPAGTILPTAYSPVAVAPDGSWSHILSSDGIYKLEFIATDKAGLEATEIRAVVVDKTLPTTPVIDPISGDYVINSLNISGTSSDATSGLLKVEYSLDYSNDGIDNDTWVDTNGTVSWFKTVDVSSLLDGSNTVYLRSTDRAGNVSAVSERSYVIDRSNPVVTVNGYLGTTYKNGTFVIDGTITDNLNLGATPVSLTVTRDTNPVALTAPTVFGGSGLSMTWSQEIPAGTDGTYTVNITGTDNVGRLHTLVKTVVVDSQAPELSGISLIDDQLITSTTLTITGAASDTGQAGVASVQYSVNGIDWNTAAGKTSWSIGLAALTDNLSREIHIKAIDNAGNESLPKIIPFKVDTALPESTVLGVDPLFKYVNTPAGVSINGVATDNNGILSVEVNLSKDGAAFAPEPVTGVGTWNITTPITEDGVYDFEIVVTDNANRSTTYTRRVGIDKKSPVLTVSNPANGEFIDSNSYVVRGQVTDNGGKGVTSLEYSRDNTNWIPITLSGLNWSVPNVDFATPVGAEGIEGSRKLYVRVSDGLNDTLYYNPDTVTGNTTTATPIEFSYDTAAPVLTETVINSEAEIISADAVFFSGAVSDTNELTSLKVSINNSLATDAGITLNPGTWTYTQSNSADGQYKLDFIATDAAGRTTKVTRNVLIDNTAPDSTVITSIPPGYSTSSLSLTGTASDATSGIAKVEWAFTDSTNDADWTTLSGTENWYGVVDVSALPEGDHTVYVRSTDRAGKVSTPSVSQTYTIDRNDPVLTVNGYDGTTYKKADFVIDGTMSDGLNIGTTPISVEVKRNGTAIAIVPVVQDSVAGTWNQAVSTSSGSGDYVITITATDASGRSVYKTKNVKVDKTKPLISLTTNLASWQGTESISITGTASDEAGGSGLSLIEYQVNSDSWKPISTNSNWSGIISVPVGDSNTLSLRSTDNAGNVSILDAHTVKVDKTIPSNIVVQAPVNLVKLNGTQDLEVLVDVTDTYSGIESARLKIGDNNFTTPDATGALNTGNINAGSWRFLVDKAKILALSGGRHDIYIEFKDNASHSGVKSFQVFVDKDAPSIPVVTSHSDNSIVNKTITFSGTASDTQSLDTVLVEIERADGSFDALTSNGTYSWSSTINTELFDTVTYDLDTMAPNYQINLRVTATDSAGNSSSVTTPLVIDQESDRPVIKLNNIDASTVDTLKLSTTIYGSVSDDDGSLSSFAISQDGTNYSVVTLSGNSWSYDVTGGDGAKSLYFKAVDSDLTEFTTTGTVKPRIWLNAAPTYSSAKIDLVVDTVTPTIDTVITADRLTPFDFAADAETKPLTTNMPFGGTSSSFAVKVPAFDTNGISTVTVNIPGIGDIPTVQGADEGGYEIFTTAAIDISGLADASLDLVITVEDNSGLKSTASRTIVIDNTVPTVSYMSPLTTQILNGNVDVKGLASDDGSGLASVKYKVGYNHASEAWQDVDGLLFSWEIGFNGINKIDTYAVSGEATDANNDEIWDLPILIQATDKAGNVFTSTESDYVLQVDPSGDKPRAQVVYPDPLEANRVLGGSIRLFGSATDDDGVGSVYIQIDVNNDGVYDALDVDSEGVDWYNGGLGQLASGSVSWNKTINSNGEFNPPGLGTRTINFRVRVRDVNLLYGPWTASNRIDVDKNVPKIGSTTPLKIVKGLTERNYVPDMWIKDNWTLQGSVEDESGISNIEISGSINGNLASRPTWFVSNGGGYDLNIPLDSVAGSTGEISFTISAYDDSSPANRTVSTITVKYDNENPTTNAYTGALPIQQSNQVYGLESTVSEVGSGFERVAFYFIRREMGPSTANDRIYAPMAPDENTLLSALSLDTNGLYYLTGSVLSRSNTRSLTDPSLIGSSFVRIGGIINIGNMDRLITAFNNSTGEVSWADEVATSILDYKIMYAQIVDHQVVENPVWSGDVLTTIENDDGDKLIESVERSGGLYTWGASIDSRNIPDGPIELHWVAFDKAGNFKKADVITTKVENNAPLLAKVTLSTDLNGDGSFTGDEIAPAYDLRDGSGNEVKSAVAGSSSFKAKGLTSVLIDIVGGNGDLKYVFTNNGTDMHGGLQSLRTSGVTSPVVVTEANLTTIGDGAKNLLFTVWDSTQETTVGVDSLSADLTVPLNVDIVDNVAPKAVISPFYWNSETDNSLYDNNRQNGHIEIDGVLDGTDPEVSGQVTISGTAYDDQRIDKLFMRIDTMTMTGTTSQTYNSQLYQEIAVQTNGIWTGVDKWASEGWKATVSTDSIDQTGHRVNWQLHWDSSKITNVADLNRVIKIVSVDKGNNPSGFTQVVNVDDTINNNPSYTVDVVPYITGVVNNANEGLTSDVIRSSNGKYSIDYHDTNVMRVLGFNLGSASNLPTSYISGSDISTEPVSGGLTTTFVDANEINVAKNISKSGYFTAFVNSIPSVNNITNLNNEGYHKEVDVTKVNSNMWTDDRYFWVWNTTQVQKSVTNQTFYYPDMIMSGNQPIFTYADDNTGAVRRTTSDTASERRANKWYERQTSVAYADSSYWILSVEDAFSGNDIGFLQINRDTNSGASTGSAGDSMIELIGEDYTSRQLNRFKYPKLLAETNGNDADLYVSYYDAHSSHKNISFVSLRATGQNTTAAGFTQATGDNTRASNTVELPLAEAGASFSQYYDMVKYGTNSIAIAYHDEAMSILRMAYNTNATTGNNIANTTSTWNTITLDSNQFTGSHVSMTYDSTYIYVAYYESGDNNLKTVRVNHTTMVPDAPVVVDAYFSVGEWTQIKIMDFDGSGTVYEPVPVISYYSGSHNGTKKSIKMAYPTSAANITEHGVSSEFAESYSGKWEVMTVPAKTVPKGGMEQFNHTQIGEYTSGSQNLPVVGWLAEWIEYSKLQPFAN